MRQVPDMCLNLISTHILDKEGYGNYFGDGKWRLSRESLVLAGGKICCTLYKTQVKMYKDVVSATQDDSLPNLWHRRLAYVSEKGLQILEKEVSHSFCQRYVT